MGDEARSLSVSAEPSRLKGVRVLVVGINYAPEVSGIGPYTAEACSAIAQAGASVTAVTGVPHYPSWAVERPYARRLVTRSREAGVDVVRVRHSVPRHQDVVRRGLYESTWFAAALPVVLRTPADAVVAVTPALAGLSLARIAARRQGVRWAAVVQDLLGAAAVESGVEGGRGVAGAVRAWEGSQLAAADLVGVIGEGFVDEVQQMGVEGPRVRLVRNWARNRPYPGDAVDARRALGWPEVGLVVAHTGNMGLKQDLGNVVRAAQDCERRGIPVTFVLMGDGSQRERLQQQAAGVSTVRILPPVSHDEYPAALAASDVLLVNQRAGVESMSLPSKLTSYFMARRPILAAADATGWTAQELAGVGGSVVLPPGVPAALADELERLTLDEAYRERLDAAARARSDTLAESAGPGRYVDLVDELLT